MQLSLSAICCFLLLCVVGKHVDGLVLEKPCCGIYHHMMANFGSTLDVSGPVVPAEIDDEYGCKGPQDRFRNKIALVKRGECRFTEKVLHAQNAGATAVIVFNNGSEHNQYASLNLVHMASATDDESELITIPSAFISQKTGNLLWSKVDLTSLVPNVSRAAVANPWLDVELGSNSPFPLVTLNSTGEISNIDDGVDSILMSWLKLMLDLFLMVWGFVALTVSINWCRDCAAKYHRTSLLHSLNLQRYSRISVHETGGAFHESATPPPQDNELTGVVDQQEDTAGLGVGPGGSQQVAGGEYEGHVGCDSCVICLSEFDDNELVVVLPCRHPYHKECIEPWLVKTLECPMCKQSVVTDDELGNELEGGQLPIQLVLSTLARAGLAFASDWVVSVNLFGTRTNEEQSAAQLLITEERRVDAMKTVAAIGLCAIALGIFATSAW